MFSYAFDPSGPTFRTTFPVAFLVSLYAKASPICARGYTLSMRMRSLSASIQFLINSMPALLGLTMTVAAFCRVSTPSRYWLARTGKVGRVLTYLPWAASTHLQSAKERFDTASKMMS